MMEVKDLREVCGSRWQTFSIAVIFALISCAVVASLPSVLIRSATYSS